MCVLHTPCTGGKQSSITTVTELGDLHGGQNHRWLPWVGHVYACTARTGESGWQVVADKQQQHGSHQQPYLQRKAVTTHKHQLKQLPSPCVIRTPVCLLPVLQDPVWLQRATRFAAFLCSATGKADWTIPDNPASLFEGAAGGICLLAELAALHASAGGQCGGGEQAQQAASARQGFVNDAEQHDALLQRSGSIAFPLFELPS